MSTIFAFLRSNNPSPGSAEAENSAKSQPLHRLLEAAIFFLRQLGIFPVYSA